MELVGAYSNHVAWADRVSKISVRNTSVQVKASEPRKQRHRRLCPDDQRAVVNTYAEGLTVYEVAARFGIDRRTVSKILRRHEVVMRNRTLTAEEVREAVRLYGEGLSLAAVGVELGFHGRTILSALRSAGVQTRDTQGRAR